MRYQYFFILSVVVTSIISCASQRKCSAGKDLTQKVNTNEPFWVKGTYCISTIKDTAIEDNESVIYMNVFDRVSGQVIKDSGVIWIKGVNNFKVESRDNSIFQIIPAGKYIIEVSYLDHLPMKTQSITIKKNKMIEIDFYIGNSLQR